MISGFNTEFKCRGRIYHVQTEDNGLSNPNIVTLLYHQGAIMASRKTSYAEMLSLSNRDELVGKLMKDQHKKMMRDVAIGAIGLDTTLGEQAPVGAAAEEATAAVEASSLELPPEPILDAGVLLEEPALPPSEPLKPSPAVAARSASPRPAVAPPASRESRPTKALDQLILEYLARELEQGKGR